MYSEDLPTIHRQLLKWTLLLLFSAVIAYMVRWEHGIYSDDYTLLVHTTKGLFERALSFLHRPVGMLAISFAFMVGEFSARILAILALLVTAYLSALLIYRISKSELGAVFGMWLIAMPIYAEDVVLWISAIQYVLASALGMMALHTYWAALTQPNHRNRNILITIILFVLATLSIEQSANFLVFLPILTYMIWRQQSRPGHSLSRLIQTLLASLAGTAFLLVISFFAFYLPSISISAERGGIDFSSAASRVSDWFTRALGLIYTTEYSHSRIKVMLELGRNVIFDNWFASLMILVIICSALYMIFSWRPQDPSTISSENGNAKNSFTLLLVITSFFIGVLSLFFPGILLGDQLLQFRMLFFSWIGLSLFAGSLIALIENLIKGTRIHRYFGKFVLFLGAIWLLFSSTTLLGFSEFYKLRYELDQAQLQAVVEAIPGNLLPQSELFYMVPYKPYDDVLGYPHSQNRYLAGILEQYWSTDTALQSLYHLNQLKTVTNGRWTPDMHFENPEGDNLTPTNLIIDGFVVPRERLVLFTYLESGEIVLYPQVAIPSNDGEDFDIISLPLTQYLIDNGVPGAGTLKVQ